MQNELSGGLPPLGQDMNGYLFLISSHTLYVEAGQLYIYNAGLSTALGGYLAGTVLGMIDGTGMWLNTVNGNTTNPDTGGAGWIPLAAYGKTTVPVTGGTVNLTAAQSKYGVIILTGALVSNLTVNLPQTLQEWLIVNTTTGAFTTTVKTAAGGSSGVIVPQGGFGSPIGVYSVADGNIYPTVAPLGIPIDQNPNPLTLVERTNAGYVLATYFNSNAPVDNTTAAHVITELGDGFFRKNTLTNFESQMLVSGLSGTVSNIQVPFSAVSQWAASLFASAALTGVPTAPTAGAGTSNTQIATTAFVNPGTSLGSSGFARLPGGLILQWGSVNVPTGLTVPVDIGIGFSIAFPSFTIGVWPVANRSVGANGQAADGSNFSSAYGLGSATITIDTNGSAAVARWFALGF
jgi:hypothetical protein